MEKYYEYDVKKYPFKEIISKVYKEHPLDKIHELIPENQIPDELLTQKTDSSTYLHNIFYEKLHSGWPELENTYKDFICKVIKPILKVEEIIYQKTPTFRAHIPNNLAVGAWHRDIDYNHPPKEKNFIIPLTDAYESNTVIVESEPRKMDFHQLEMRHGQLISFNGNECTHGSLPNKTGVTRVSMDFRVVLLEDYNSNYKTTSMTRNMKFKIGEYYEKI